METFFKLSPQDYIKATENADMNNEYRFFEPHLHPGDLILDVGFGSGRDMQHFNRLGYHSKGIDIEEEFVEHGNALGLDVEHVQLEKYNPDVKFDAVWACASLVHASMDELPTLFNKIKSLLKPGGIAYCSFKYGEWEGYIAETYYTYLTEEKLQQFDLEIVDMHIVEDSLNRNNKWIAFIFKN